MSKTENKKWEQVQESAINVISQGTRLEGKLHFDQITRVHGVLVGEVQSREGSTLILSETSVVEGRIHADRLIVDGFVRGDISSIGKVTLSRTGRVVGNIRAASVELEYGAYFEGKCTMDLTSSPGPGPKLVST